MSNSTLIPEFIWEELRDSLAEMRQGFFKKRGKGGHGAKAAARWSAALVAARFAMGMNEAADANKVIDELDNLRPGWRGYMPGANDPYYSSCFKQEDAA